MSKQTSSLDEVLINFKAESDKAYAAELKRQEKVRAELGLNPIMRRTPNEARDPSSASPESVLADEPTA